MDYAHKGQNIDFSANKQQQKQTSANVALGKRIKLDLKAELAEEVNWGFLSRKTVSASIFAISSKQSSPDILVKSGDHSKD